MSAMNALTKSGHQTATPKLRTSIHCSSRREKALTIHGFWDLLLTYPPSEMLTKKGETFQLKVKCSALYQPLTKNFIQKTEIPEMLKCRFWSPFFNHSLVLGAWASDIYRLAFGNWSDTP